MRSEQNDVILDGPISKFNVKCHSLVKRYLVLGHFAIFVYQDESTYSNSPEKPCWIIPLAEISKI